MARKKKKGDNDPAPLGGAVATLEAVMNQRDEAARAVSNIDEILGGYNPTFFPNMALTPQLAAAGARPGAATSVLPGGAGAVPEPPEERGFLATFWPFLLALAVGALAFFFLDWSWWAAGLALVGTLVAARFAAAFLQASGGGEA